jgi:hypothetical protein
VTAPVVVTSPWTGWLRDAHTMPLSSAEKQARYRARNVVLLTADARAIADKLLEIEDQAKLIQVAGLLREKLHPTDGRCRWVKDDGGRRKSDIARGAARKDAVGYCVTRAIAIATGKSYEEVHTAITAAKVRYVYAGGEKGRYRDYWNSKDDEAACAPLIPITDVSPRLTAHI